MARVSLHYEQRKHQDRGVVPLILFINRTRVVRLALLLILVISITLCGNMTEERTFVRDNASSYYSFGDSAADKNQLLMTSNSKTIEMVNAEKVFERTLRTRQETTLPNPTISSEPISAESRRREHQPAAQGKQTPTVGASLSRERVVRVQDGSATTRNVVGGNTTGAEDSHDATADNQQNQQRVLLLRNPFVHGHANQQQCLHLASVLAVQYNRTLLLPHDAGCRPNKHQNFGIPIKRLYDTERAKRMIDYRELASGETTPSQCRDSSSIPFKHSPEFKVSASDPFAQDSCIVFDCEWADTHMQAPKSIFPKVDEIYFRYHDRYWEMGKKLLAKMSTSGGTNNRILAIQIRRGDRFTWPLLNCPSSDNDPLLSRLCRRSEEILEQKGDLEMMWDDLFKLLPESTSGNKTTVDAIFVATNDANYVHALKKHHGSKNKGRRKLAPLHMMKQFMPQIKHLLLPETLSSESVSSAVELLVIEQVIMALAGRYIPSFPSTVPDHVLRMRLSLQPQNEREQHHYDLYDSKFAGHFKVMDQKEFLRANSSKKNTKQIASIKQ